MDLYTKAHLFLYYLKEDRGYKTSSNNKIVCVKRTEKKIVLSNGVIVHLKEKNGMKYLAAASFVKGYKRYEYLNQILLDIQGYLSYKIQTKHANVLTLS